MDQLIKIAVCFSGETRYFNEHKKISYSWEQLRRRLLEEEIAILEFYGHTWAHCDDPEMDILQFRKYSKTDQVEIDEWVCNDFVMRSVTKEAWKEIPEFVQANINEKIPIYLDMSRRGYGQFISAYKCWNMIEGNPDLCFRTRWDVEIFADYIEELVEHCRGIKAGHWPYTSFNEQLYLLTTTAIGYGPQTRNEPEDFFFAVRLYPSVFKRLKQDPFVVLEDTLINAEKDNSTITSHSLWETFFRTSSFTALPILSHNMAKIFRPPGSPTSVSRNKWSI